jgi:hypothetical protein
MATPFIVKPEREPVHRTNFSTGGESPLLYNGQFFGAQGEGQWRRNPYRNALWTLN